MQVHRSLEALPKFRNPVVTTGSFDGVHIGHQRIFAKIRELASRYHGESVVITFDPHPREVVFPRDKSLKLLTSIDEKIDLFRQQGIDHAVILPFTVEFSQQSPREYIEKFIIGAFNPECLVIGYDHRFGLNREGDYSLLKQYADKGHFELVLIDKQEVDDITVSSTKVRKAISEGNIRKANSLLGYHYGLRGKVVHGNKLGQKLGFPTANIRPDTDKKRLPPEGIYAAFAFTDETRHEAMLYIGKKPTVADEDPKLVIECHIIDFAGDLYGSSIRLEIIARIRDDQKMESLDALSKAIAQDKKNVIEVLRSEEKRNTKPTVAIAALNYNGESIIDDCFPSWLRERGELTDLVFIDNHSSDRSTAIIRSRYPEFQLIELDRNYGFAEGYNRGLRDLKHKYIALVNSDVELTPGWLNPIIDLMEANPEVAICQPKILDYKDKRRFEYAGGSGGYIDRFGIPFCAGRILHSVEEDNGQYDETSEIFWATGAAFVIRRKLFFDFGGFDGDFFAHMEEIDLCWRVKRAGFRVMSVPAAVVYHIGGSTLSYDNPRKVFLNFRNNLAMLWKNEKTTRLIATIPSRMLLDFMALLNYLVRGKTSQTAAVIRAYLNFIAWIPELTRKSRSIRRLVRANSINSPNLTGRYGKSIIWQYYGRGKKTFSSLNWKPDARK